MDITDSDLDPLRDIYLALHTAASHQTSIRHADTKAQTLLGIDGGITVVLVDHAFVLLRFPPPSLFFALTLAGAALAGLALSAGRLLLVIAPQLIRPKGRNRFAFPSMASLDGRPAAGSLQRQRDEAWDLVSTLARIAAAKHAAVRRSIAPLIVTLAASGALLALAFAISGPR